MKAVIAIVALLVLFFFFIRFIERKSLYFPMREIAMTPEDLGLAYDEIFITTKDGVQISGWYIPSDKSRATLLISHGNGGNISHRLEKIRMLHALNVNILIFDYRGYGMSKGSPSEKGLSLDAEAFYAYLMEERKASPGEVVGYGESLGGAVIVDLAGRRELGGLIIEGSFSSVRDMAKNYFPFIPSFVYKTSFDSSKKIKQITIPKLHFHSLSDEIVPLRLGRKLYDNAPEPKEFVNLQGGHNDSFIVSRDTYISKIDAFIDGLKL